MQRLAVLTAVVFSTTAYADHRHQITVADRDPSDDQIIVVNAVGTNTGQVSRIHRALDQRGMLFHLSDSLEATLEGRNMLLSDLDSIKNAYASGDFDSAMKIIAEDEKRLLEHGGGDVPISLSLLAGWRGLILGHDEKDDEAVEYFRAAIRYNPAWTVDKKIPSPHVRSLIAKARREPDQTGTLKTIVDPENAVITIDGGVTKSSERQKLTTGFHLVQISAEGKKTYAEIVTIVDGKTAKIDTSLQPESQLDKAAKLVDETVAAPAGAARLDHAKQLSKLTGSNRILVVEGAGDDHVNVRLYDISLKKISKTFSLDGNASSAAIASEIKSAFDPDNAPDGTSFDPGGGGGDEHHESKWYQKWYIYAGAAILVGGIFLTYEYSTREPTSIKGF